MPPAGECPPGAEIRGDFLFYSYSTFSALRDPAGKKKKSCNFNSYRIFVKTVEKKFLEPPVKNGDPLKNQAAVLPLRIKL
jgi:hypothetical protein